MPEMIDDDVDDDDDEKTKLHCLPSVEFVNYCLLLEVILCTRKREEGE